MLDEANADLSRIFRQANTTLSDGAFISQLFAKIEGSRRRRRYLEIFAVASFTVIALSSFHVVLEKTAAIVGLMAGFLPRYADLAITPLGWAVSMLVGIWSILRTRPSRH
jgi:hypothetical protein